MPNGQNLIAGDWVESHATFENNPVEWASRSFFQGSPALVDRAARSAEAAFATYAETSRDRRARFLRAIVDEIETRGAAITRIGTRETGLPAARLEAERGRTCGQLRLFADHIEAGDYLDRRHDPALPDRAPIPRPDLRMIQRPIGPIAVFGASNFPLAFSTAGGDTASALAAGCPVIVKGHEAHPGTTELVADAILSAIRASGLPEGIFSMIHGGSREVGQALVQHPLIRAVGFTGSLGGGRALFDLCAARPDPIPFFGELGSVNPMFVLPAALAARREEIAKGWAASLTQGAGQFCTNPGLVILPEGIDASRFADSASEAIRAVGSQTMLTDGIAGAFRTGRDAIAGAADVEVILPGDGNGRHASPSLFRVAGSTWRTNPALAHEVFGPSGIIVTASGLDEMVEIATGLEGQLTSTLHVDEADIPDARRLMPILERKVGRILANGFPTGVEVSDAMVHGGPYPASTNFGATSVGTLSIRRWLRPVCYQGVPAPLLPPDLQ
ncbi:aldehyde dehydrogenase (NADP(+)) [Jannaschia aquimarina]|uniref:Alpha-ketoglutaric semialdehyde dehydrogenase n=1 Tax=Jannaschia aquimarina TaxID=935700 RepID=A0A0D1EKD6_9RHOB|nr:aldehyde dehydrogenase (NADP(+)) [Jannaschia aquimarina]KIT16240.1 Alpha-ketoglutaric semialdehyde dehydrogenase [Jannaschia aquimarina]SNT15499.1 NADP-dependent aldehyde dehydrogenase [Jannaschia aquimarina]